MPLLDKHWDDIFSTTQENRLGWYEKDLSKTMHFLETIPYLDNRTFFLAGAGTTLLLDELLSYEGEIIVNDISSKALDALKARVGTEKENIHYLCQDISLNIETSLPEVDVWIDRAVLHFLTQENQKQTYLNNLKKVLNVGAYLLLAEFSKTGAKQCAGLPVCQYDLASFETLLGDAFQLQKSCEHIYINPNGDERPYIYALYKRLK